MTSEQQKHVHSDTDNDISLKNRIGNKLKLQRIVTFAQQHHTTRNNKVNESDEGDDRIIDDTIDPTTMNNNTTNKVTPTILEIEKLTQRNGINRSNETFKVQPDYAYPNTRMNRDQLRKEMNQPSSYFHDLGISSNINLNDNESRGIGQVSVEVLQCFGIPHQVSDVKSSTTSSSSTSATAASTTNTTSRKLAPFALIVCGKYAFQTDCMPPNTLNPMWLCKMRRACRIPIHHAYARVYIGILRQRQQEKQSASAVPKRDLFIGRVVIDIARLRPDCTYDVTLPLRQSSNVYVREQLGAIRFRIQLRYDSERRALLSYLPTNIFCNNMNKDDNTAVVHCCDKKSFQNVARVVYGTDMPHRFSIRRMQATIREINLTRIHVLRYLRKEEVRNLYHWRYPLISSYLFLAYLHSIYYGTIKYVPGHIISYFLLHLWRNYAYYYFSGGIDSTSSTIRPSKIHNGFLPPTWEELFMALFFGSSDGCKYIEKIEMMKKQQHETNQSGAVMLDRYSEDDDSTTEISLSQHETLSHVGHVSLRQIAVAFENGIHLQNLRYHFRMYRNVFKGSDAVTFLITYGFASSRDHAVTIGRRLESEMKLFEHVTRGHHFEDKPYFYTLSHHDRDEYVINTHCPRGKSLFQLMGFLPSHHISKTKAQLEMPYTDGIEHPRLRVKESIVLQNKCAKKAVQHELDHRGETESNDDSEAPEDFELGLAEFLDHNNMHESGNEFGTINESVNEFSSMRTNARHLKKPPNQNMAIKTKADKPIHVVLNEALQKVHGAFLNVFNNPVYKLPDNSYGSNREPVRKLSPIKSARNVIGKSTSPTQHADTQSKNSHETTDVTTTTQLLEQSEAQLRQNEYDKLLGIGRYSHPNAVISRLGLIIQPIIEIALIWLSLFRSLFNIFTWQDPIVSFWISLLGPILVIILHTFPWRLVLGITGMILLGPQNWIIRIVHERRYGPDTYDPDIVVDSIKNKSTLQDKKDTARIALFSSYTPNNDPSMYTDEFKADVTASGRTRQIVVPYTWLMYSHRFYDWPPESEYAHVVGSTSIENHGITSSKDVSNDHSVVTSNEITRTDSSDRISHIDPMKKYIHDEDDHEMDTSVFLLHHRRRGTVAKKKKNDHHPIDDGDTAAPQRNNHHHYYYNKFLFWKGQKKIN